jgi:hypothetical protein
MALHRVQPVGVGQPRRESVVHLSADIPVLLRSFLAMTTTSPDAGTVLAQSHGAVTVLTLSYAARRNALSMPLRAALHTQLEQAMADPECRAVVLTGEGGHFCSGGDISSFGGVTPASGRARMQRVHAIVRLLVRGEKPVIAAVEGHAAGAGLCIAAACDVVVASARKALLARVAASAWLARCSSSRCMAAICCARSMRSLLSTRVARLPTCRPWASRTTTALTSTGSAAHRNFKRSVESPESPNQPWVGSRCLPGWLGTGAWAVALSGFGPP